MCGDMMVKISAAQGVLLAKLSNNILDCKDRPYVPFYGEGKYRFRGERGYVNRCTVEVLLRNGLAEVQKQSRKDVVILTDAGREWISQNLQDERQNRNKAMGEEGVNL